MPRYEVTVYDERMGIAEVEAASREEAVSNVWAGEAEVEWVSSDWAISVYDVVEIDR